MPVLSNNHRLWVPMQVKALAFKKGGPAKWVDLTPDYGSLGDQKKAPLAARLRPRLDASGDPDFLEPGIHLHWTLPAAFTHVRPSSNGTDDASKPLAPNRWLVLRLSETETGKLSRRSWIVESDFMDPFDATAPWLEETGTGIEITQLGRKVPLRCWREATGPGKATENLTAFAPGNLGFAASYPSCQGVFGFHDRAKHLKVGTVYTYFVAGWFSSAASDPLSDKMAPPGDPEQTSEQRWSRRRQQNQWSIPESSTIWPTALTCYGVAQGIEWTSDPNTGSGPSDVVNIALGNSVVEAIAALVKRNAKGTKRLASLLQLATLGGQRPTRRDMLGPDKNFFTSLGQMLGARTKLHQRAFSARHGGVTWEIGLPEKGNDGQDSDARPVPELPPDLSAQLAILSRVQRELDEAARILDASRRRLFAAWYLHQHRSTTGVGKPDDQHMAGLLAQIQTCKDNVKDWASRRTDRQADRDAALGTLQAMIRQSGKDGEPEFELAERPVPRFWRASDPFLMMDGVQVPLMQGGASPLMCRVSDQTVQGIQVAGVPNFGDLVISREDLKANLEIKKVLPVHGDLPPHLGELVLDTLFADPQRARLLARIVLEKRFGNASLDQIELLKKAIGDKQKAIETAAAALTGASGTDSDNNADLPLYGIDGPAQLSLLSAITLPSTPARPVFMVWQAKWYPHGQKDNEQISDLWGLDDGIDLRWRNASGPEDDQASTLGGFVPIATGLERGLAMAGQKHEDDYRFILERLKHLSGQSLMGLTDALAGRASGPQMRPLQLDKRTGRLVTVPEISELVGQYYSATPLLDDQHAPPISPIRAGHFHLSRLWIVDNFGRIQKLIDKDDGNVVESAPIIGQSLSHPELPSSANLPPRLVQPARLQLRWLSAVNADQESLGDLGTSPICGVIVHNRLDRSVLIFGTDISDDPSVGRLLGMVQAVSGHQGSEQVIWSKLPKRPFGLGDSGRPDAADIPNKALRNFINGLLTKTRDSGTVFQAFRDLLDRHEETADLSQDQGLQSALMGRPLVLARASLSLELEGLAHSDEIAHPPEQGMQAGLEDAAKQPARSGAPRFPVRVGDRRLGSDGLVGYFVEDGSAAAYDTLRLRSDKQFDPAVVANAYFGKPALEVSCDPLAGPTLLTLLLDPMRGVNIVSGILPSSVSAIPRALLTKALSNLEIPFMVAPVLGERDGYRLSATSRSMPLPTDGHDEWSWVFFSDVEGAEQKVPVGSDTAAASSLATAKALHEGWLQYRPAKGDK